MCLLFQNEFREYPSLLRHAVSLGRRIQDPLSEFAALCVEEDELLCLRLHPFQVRSCSSCIPCIQEDQTTSSKQMVFITNVSLVLNQGGLKGGIRETIYIPTLKPTLNQDLGQFNLSPILNNLIKSLIWGPEPSSTSITMPLLGLNRAEGFGCDYDYDKAYKWVIQSSCAVNKSMIVRFIQNRSGSEVCLQILSNIYLECLLCRAL